MRLQELIASVSKLDTDDGAASVLKQNADDAQTAADLAVKTAAQAKTTAVAARSNVTLEAQSLAAAILSAYPSNSTPPPPPPVDDSTTSTTTAGDAPSDTNTTDPGFID